MTPIEIERKLMELYKEWLTIIHPMPEKELKEYIKNAPKRAILHELELNHRINGGKEPIVVITDKMCKENKCKNIHINYAINFQIKN